MISQPSCTKQILSGLIVVLALFLVFMYVIQTPGFVPVQILPLGFVPAQIPPPTITWNNRNVSAAHDIQNITDSEQCHKRLPGAIIAGVAKCGTGAITVFLNLHPQIAAVMKPNRSDGNIPLELKFYNSKFENGMGWYLNQMPCSVSGQVTVEKDPLYFYEPLAPMRIQNTLPDVKLIFIVKDPIERAISKYVMMMDLTDTTASYTGFLEEVTDEKGFVNIKNEYIQKSTYALYIRNWLEQFQRENILFVDGHQFENDPVEELRKIEHFLNIEPFYDNSMFWFNETKGKQCFYSRDDKPVCLLKGKGREHPTISRELRLKLQNYFKPLNEQFFRTINQRFNWGY